MLAGMQLGSVPSSTERQVGTPLTLIALSARPAFTWSTSLR
jgi:hypothetical protein